MSKSEPQVKCPHCGKMYKWKQGLANRKVSCKCGQMMRMPTEASGVTEAIGPPPDPGKSATSYELDLSDEQSSGGADGDRVAVEAVDGKCPSCNAELRPSAVLCVKCGFSLQAGQQMETTVATGDEPEPPPNTGSGRAQVTYSKALLAMGDGAMNLQAMKERAARDQFRKGVVIPAILAGVGLILVLVNSFVLIPVAHAMIAKAWGGAAVGASTLDLSLFQLAQVFIRLVIQVPILLLSIIIVAKLFKTSFGTLGTALLKLLAIALLGGTINDSVVIGLKLVTSGLGGIGAAIIAISVQFAVFWTLCGWLLDTDMVETVVLYLLSILLPWFVMFYILYILVSMFF